jgi:hypothetical protein
MYTYKLMQGPGYNYQKIALYPVKEHVVIDIHEWFIKDKYKKNRKIVDYAAIALEDLFEGEKDEVPTYYVNFMKNKPTVINEVVVHDLRQINLVEKLQNIGLQQIQNNQKQIAQYNQKRSLNITEMCPSILCLNNHQFIHPEIAKHPEARIFSTEAEANDYVNNRSR